MPRLLLACFLAFLTSAGWCQPERQLTPEVKAYLFHTVRKSPILERNIGNAFEYSGPVIKLEDGQINYDSIDKILIIEPNYLVIRSEILKKSSKGILTEACNKTAIYEMCRQIGLYNSGASTKGLPLLLRYFTLIFEALPYEFQRGKVYDALTSTDYSPILLTNVSFNERLYIMKAQAPMKVDELKDLFEAQEKAINKTIGERTLQLFGLLGGVSNKFESLLMAAGDGSYTEGLLRERDRDENGEWNKGLPKAIGLFPYKVSLTKDKKPELKTSRITERSMYTFGNNQNTELHFDVWGYNSNNQTTVIVEKGNRQYPLFGSTSTRFLTPDSSFSKGVTFMKILNDLYQKTYIELNNNLFSENGLDKQLKDSKQLLGEIETAINEKEGDLGELYKEDYHTSNKLTRKERKEILKGSLTGEKNIKTKTKARKKAKNKKQWDLVDLYGAYDETFATMEALTAEYNTAADEYNAYLDLYNKYKFQLGTQWLSFTEKDGLYTFADGTTFDIYTQNLVFPPNDSSELVQVRLLSIPEDYEGNASDEIMLHISMVDAEPFYDADYSIEFNDVFLPDSYAYQGSIFNASDSVFLKKLFTEYEKSKLPIKLSLEGKGIGMLLDSIVVRDPLQSELPSYPGADSDEINTARMSSAFKSLRQSRVQLKLNRSIQIHIESTTDPVKSNLTSSSFSVDSYLNSNKISKNELLSLLRTRTIMLQLKRELVSYSAKYLPQPLAKKFIDELELISNKAKYQVGDTFLKAPKIKD